MSRGRKTVSIFEDSNWSTVFYNSVGSYVGYINKALSKEYRLEPLSKHIKIVGGYAFQNSQYKKTGIPIIRISDFNNEKIHLDQVVYYDESSDLEKYELKENDIVIALTGGTIAKLAIVQGGLGKIYLNQRVGKFEVINPEVFELEYIYWIARSVQSTIKNLAWGAAIPNVSPKQIEAIEFPFPPKNIQKGIISFLNAVKNQAIIKGKIYFNADIENKVIGLQDRQIVLSTLLHE
jgi:restriction endonuclease S subunit